MPVPLIAAGVAAVGTIGGAVISSSSQKSAANKAAAAQQTATDSQLQLGRENINFQQGIYDQNKALLSPFVQRGNVAGDSINALLGLGGAPQAAQAQQPVPGAQGYQTAPVVAQQPLNAMYDGTNYGDGPHFHYQDGETLNRAGARFQAGNSFQHPAQQQGVAQPQATGAAPATNALSATDAFNNFANSAGMQFQLQQGTNAIANNAAARGGFQSGAALKALQNYGQNTALNNYFMPYLGLLQGQQATGAQSGSAIAGVGSNFGNTVSSIYGQQGNAIQSGADATSNAALLRGQANAGLGNSIGSALGTFGSSFANNNPFASGGSGYNAYNSAYNMPVTFGSPHPLPSVPVSWGGGY